MQIHDLKILPDYIESILARKKTFEIRSEADRSFKEGDYLLLREWHPHTLDYTGRYCLVKVIYCARNNMLKKGHVVMSIELCQIVPKDCN